MSKWKVEKWTEIWTGFAAEPSSGKDREEKIKKHWSKFNKRAKLGFREIVLLCSAEIDLGMAEFISRKLCNDESEIVDLLGANEDGRAPIGSFGARAQLAYLLGLIDKPTLQLIRLIKKLRNGFAHKVKWDWNTVAVQKLIGEVSIAFYIMGGCGEDQLNTMRNNLVNYEIPLKYCKFTIMFATNMVNCFLSKLIPKATRLVPEFVVIKDILG